MRHRQPTVSRSVDPGWVLGWVLVFTVAAGVCWGIWFILPSAPAAPVYEPDLPRVTVSAGVVTPTCGIIAVDPVTDTSINEGRCR